MDALGSQLQQSGFQVAYASSKQHKILRLLDMLRAVWTNRKTADYVLIDTYSTQNFYYAYAVSQLCRFFKLKYLPILHGGNLPNRLKKSPKLSAQLFNHAYALVSPSLYLKQAFEAQGYPNITFIPNTIQIENYPYRQKTMDTPKLFWLRSFKALYNPKMAVAVVALLKDKGVDCALCMVGPDGGDGTLSEVKTLAKQHNINIDFKGKLSKPEWIALSKNYNIFVNTTNFDNMPVSVVEAMALGFPIVSTNVGGLPYLIEDGKTGLLVEANKATDMAASIERLITHPDLVATLSKNAREQALQFDWKQVAKQWETLLK
jgi:colanic acid/amylovoran biosynthesis glycosyltransferase